MAFRLGWCVQAFWSPIVVMAMSTKKAKNMVKKKIATVILG